MEYASGAAKSLEFGMGSIGVDETFVHAAGGIAEHLSDAQKMLARIIATRLKPESHNESTDNNES